MNNQFKELVHELATECGIADKKAAEKFAASLGTRWMGINTPFICGGVGRKDMMGLPEKLLVCPSYGLDGFAMYEKITEYDSPAW